MRLRSLSISVLAVAAMTAGLFARSRGVDFVRMLPSLQSPDSAAVEVSDGRSDLQPRMRRRPEPAAAEGPDTAVIFMKADWVTRRQIDTARVTCFTGNFAAHHNGTIITADSAIRYSDSYVECFGNVLINKNTTYVYGDRADYDSELEIANIYSPIVKMVDGDATLYSYNFSFDTRNNIGTFHGGGMVINRENRLESDRGYYYSDYHEVICVDRVEVHSETYEMKGDSVIYNIDTDDAYYFDRSNIWNDKNEYLYADCGEYHRDGDLYKVTRNGYMLTATQEVWSDTIDYWRADEHAVLRRNIQIDDSEHKTMGFGDYGEYWGADERALLTVRPSVVNYDVSQGDTLYMRSDSIFLYTIMVLPDGTERVKGDPEPEPEPEPESESAETEGSAGEDADESGAGATDSGATEEEALNEAADDDAESADGEAKEQTAADDGKPEDVGGAEDMRGRMMERRAARVGAADSLSGRMPAMRRGAQDSVGGAAAQLLENKDDAKTYTGDAESESRDWGDMADSIADGFAGGLADSLALDSLTLDSLARELTPEELKARQREEAARIKAEKKAAAAKARKEKLARISAARLKKLQEQKVKDEAAAAARREKVLAAKRKALARENAKRAKRGLPPLDDTLANLYPSLPTDSLHGGRAGITGITADSLPTERDSLAAGPDSLAAGTDSLKMGADSLRIGADSLAEVPRDSSYRRVQCYRDVRIYRNDFQALCDSLVAFSSDSTAHMYIRPVLWNGSNQVNSEVMDIFTENQMITRADFVGKPMMIAELDTMTYNQVTGKTMTAAFDEHGQIYRNDVNGNVETVYYLQDSGTGEITDAMYLMSGDATYYIAHQQVETITYRTNAEGQLSPLTMIPEDQKTRLEGFEWRGSERPGRDDVFDRQIRPSQRERVESLSRPRFPISRDIESLMRRLIERGEWLDRVDILSPEDEEWRRETLAKPYK